MKKLETYAAVNVAIAFYQANGTLVKSYNGSLSENGDYTLFRTIKANNETLYAGEDAAIFGNVITNIPNGAYAYFTVISKKNGASV